MCVSVSLPIIFAITVNTLSHSGDSNTTSVYNGCEVQIENYVTKVTDILRLAE